MGDEDMEEIDEDNAIDNDDYQISFLLDNDKNNDDDDDDDDDDGEVDDDDNNNNDNDNDAEEDEEKEENEAIEEEEEEDEEVSGEIDEEEIIIEKGGTDLGELIIQEELNEEKEPKITTLPFSSSRDQFSYELVQNAYHHQSWSAKETTHLVALLAKTQLYSESKIVNLLLLSKVPMTVEVCEALHLEGISISDEYMIKIVKESTQNLTLTDYIASILGLIQAELLSIVTIKDNMEEEIQDMLEINMPLLDSITCPPKKLFTVNHSTTMTNPTFRVINSPTFSDWIQLYFGILQYYDKIIERMNFSSSSSSSSFSTLSKVNNNNKKDDDDTTNTNHSKEQMGLDQSNNDSNLTTGNKSTNDGHIYLQKKLQLKSVLAGLIERNLSLEQDQQDFMEFLAQEGINIQ